MSSSVEDRSTHFSQSTTSSQLKTRLGIVPSENIREKQVSWIIILTFRNSLLCLYLSVFPYRVILVSLN